MMKQIFSPFDMEGISMPPAFSVLPRWRKRRAEYTGKSTLQAIINVSAKKSALKGYFFLKNALFLWKGLSTKHKLYSTIEYKSSGIL